MPTIIRGRTITREITSIRTAVEDERNEHREAKAEFRKALAEPRGVFGLTFKRYLGLFDLMCEQNDQWREAVYRDEEPYSAQAEKEVKELFQLWMQANDLMRQTAEFYARQGLPLDSRLCLDFRLYTQEVTKILENWTAPQVASAFGERVVKLDRC